ncbi:hypothetical protein F0562_015421 [Nyssa sinensis]|uniref:Uncharacterized protein n=1 Tax=Nyssa sinensis TaxID=561372 RepID=A0A5J4ZL06_9ASTE|nr:hypothetical protein F0562_015421 [Nyssa sinensis]
MVRGSSKLTGGGEIGIKDIDEIHEVSEDDVDDPYNVSREMDEDSGEDFNDGTKESEDYEDDVDCDLELDDDFGNDDELF